MDIGGPILLHIRVAIANFDFPDGTKLSGSVTPMGAYQSTSADMSELERQF